MKVEFDVKYGENTIAIPLGNGTYKFKVKYGTNIIEIPGLAPKQSEGMVDLWSAKVTIYNDIPSDGVNPRRFDRKVIELCNVQKGILQNTDGTIEKVANALTVITKDIGYYKTPFEYANLPADEKDVYFTANINDFVVLGEVDDVVTTSREFQELQEKYKKYGFSVTAVNEYLNGMSVDNVQIIHA